MPTIKKTKPRAEVIEKPVRMCNKFALFTFAARMGQERTTDLSKSIPAYFRHRLIRGNG